MSHHPIPEPLEVKYVTVSELRRRFNEGQYWERAKSGEFIEEVRSQNRPAEPLDGETDEIMSQMVSYLKDGVEIARVHQYVRPDGSLAAFGKPDPKKLLEDGVVFCQERKRS